MTNRIAYFMSRFYPIIIIGFLVLSALPWNDANAINLIDPKKFTDDGKTTEAKRFAEASGFATGDSSATINDIIGLMINVVLSLVGTAFLVLIVYGGIILFQARGEDAEVKKAQKIIEQGVIGLVIVLGAFAISQFVVSRFATQLLKQDAL